MKKLFIIALMVLGSFVSLARADITPEKRVEIEKLFRLTGSEKLMTQMMGQMVAAMTKGRPDVGDDFWNRFTQKMDMHELIEKIIPVYDKYYTLDDLKAINAFYESPAGHKILSSLPQVMKESMQIGQAWSEKIGRQAATEIQREKQGK